MGDKLGDPIFIFFVVFMVVLFMILLIKRLNKKSNPMDLEAAALEALSRDFIRGRHIPTISVAVHLHEHRSRSGMNAAPAARTVPDSTAPPPFESVVGQTVATPEKQSSLTDEPPPPSYEEYLSLREKIAQ